MTELRVATAPSVARPPSCLAPPSGCRLWWAQISEVVNGMKDLIDLSHNGHLGPIGEGHTHEMTMPEFGGKDRCCC